uniref:Peptidyl-tRNA hydrolase 1 homolog n=1 Tax=Dromaius novaehollandiae TaxID=8790 RepID=A0A8C4KNE6_DRONO
PGPQPPERGRESPGEGRSWTPRSHRRTGNVAGLGNYGLRGTRHSVGMAVLDRLAGRLAVADRWRADGRCCGDVAVATAHGVELVLLKPRRLMNLNGLSVASAAKMYNLSPEDIYLVHDDLDKALGKVAIKLGGSARGVGVSVGRQTAPPRVPPALPGVSPSGCGRGSGGAGMGSPGRWPEPLSVCMRWDTSSCILEGALLEIPGKAPGGKAGCTWLELQGQRGEQALREGRGWRQRGPSVQGLTPAEGA